MYNRSLTLRVKSKCSSEVVCITANGTNLVKCSILFLFYLNSPILFAIYSFFPMTPKILQTDKNMKILSIDTAPLFFYGTVAFLELHLKFTCVEPGVLQLI